MPSHVATVRWNCQGPNFLQGQYSREHVWIFDGGLHVPASPSPHIVPAPWSNPANVDPEEAFVAAVASCHMLTFLWLASKAGYSVSDYEDNATGIMTRNERGVAWISQIILQPKIVWSGDSPPDSDTIAALHQQAHNDCFIANSILTKITV